MANPFAQFVEDPPAENPFAQFVKAPNPFAQFVSSPEKDTTAQVAQIEAGTPGPMIPAQGPATDLMVKNKTEAGATENVLRDIFGHPDQPLVPISNSVFEAAGPAVGILNRLGSHGQGVTEGVKRSIEGVLTPNNLSIIGVSSILPPPIQKLIALGFGAKMLHDAPDEFAEAIKEKDPKEKAAHITQGIIGALMGIGGVRFGISEARAGVRPSLTPQKELDTAIKDAARNRPSNEQITDQHLDGIRAAIRATDKLAEQHPENPTPPKIKAALQYQISDVKPERIAQSKIREEERTIASQPISPTEQPPPSTIPPAAPRPAETSAVPPTESGRASSFTQAIKEQLAPQTTAADEEAPPISTEPKVEPPTPPGAETPVVAGTETSDTVASTAPSAEEITADQKTLDTTTSYDALTGLAKKYGISDETVKEGFNVQGQDWLRDKIREAMRPKELGQLTETPVGGSETPKSDESDFAKSQVDAWVTQLRPREGLPVRFAPSDLADEIFEMDDAERSAVAKHLGIEDDPAVIEETVTKIAGEGVRQVPVEDVQDIEDTQDIDARVKQLFGGGTQARKFFSDWESQGPGAASAGEFEKRQTVVGASAILEGARTFGRWKKMVSERLGEQVSEPDWKALFRKSKGMLKDFVDAQGEAKTQKVVTKAREEGALAQRKEWRPMIAELRAKIADSISKAEALSVFLKGQEKGAKVASEAARKQTTENIHMADRWAAADQERVRNDMVEFVNKTLPPAERGRFTNAITRALRRPDVVTGDPSVMYRNAFRVMRAIENRAEELHHEGLVADIKSTYKRATESPGVDVQYKQLIREAMDGITRRNPTERTIQKQQRIQKYIDSLRAKGQEVPAELLRLVSDLGDKPLKELPADALEAMKLKLDLLERMGRQRVVNRKIAWDMEKSERAASMRNAPAQPVEENPILRAQPGEKATGMQKVANWLNTGRNWFRNEEHAHAPMDELYDLLDGGKANYDGWVTRNIRGNIDLAYNRERAEFHPVMDEAKRIAKKNGLKETDEERIGVHAIMQMEGGRARLAEMGVSDDTMAKSEKLTPGQQELYKYMRTSMDAILPRIQEVKRLLDNEDVRAVENYFPLMRDWVEFKKTEVATPSETTFDEDATGRQVVNDLTGGKFLSTKAAQGFTKERVKGAKTAVKVNAMDVYERHITDALHYVHTQPELRMLGQLVRSPEFQAKYGKLGQHIILDHLDTVARQGGVSRFQRLRFLDAVRNNTSRAAVGFRVASNLVHLSQLPYAAMHAGGPQWWARGLHEAMTEKGQQFLIDHAAETRERSGGEPAQADVENKSRLGHAGFAVARNIDRLNAQATFLGRYFKEMSEKGISPDQALSLPVDPAAQRTALTRMRRAVASPLYKDVPQALSRGKGYGGNVSVSRAVNQFRNIFLDNWSNIRHDLFRGGIGDAVKSGLTGDNSSKVATVAAVTLMSIVMETGIKYGIKQGISAGVSKVMGHEDKEEKGQLVKDFTHHLINRVPILGQLISAAMYGETGIPAVDSLVKPLHEGYIASKSKRPGTKLKHEEGAAGALATLLGVPGSGQITEILMDAQKKSKSSPSVRLMTTGKLGTLKKRKGEQ